MGKVTLYKNLLNPEEALIEYKDSLVKRYIEDYGKEYSDLIKERINSTIYLFESNPLDNLLFIKDNFEYMTSLKKIISFNSEYKNYIKVKKKLDEAFEDAKYKIINEKFKFNSSFDKRLIDLDLDSYSTSNQLLMNDENIDSTIKEKISNRQSTYEEDCQELGVNPIFDGTIIDELINKIRCLDEKENELLIGLTSWGQRVKNFINSSGCSCSDLEISRIVFNKNMLASTNIVYSPSGYRRICYVPLFKIDRVGAIDRIFFHENRHIIETTSKYCGIDRFDTHKYSLINEIRTEKNALDDIGYFSDYPLFSNEDYKKNWRCNYEELFPYTVDFFENNRGILNDISINNDIQLLEKLYGENGLVLFNNYLENILKNISLGGGVSDNENMIAQGEELVKKLNKNVVMV